MRPGPTSLLRALTVLVSLVSTSHLLIGVEAVLQQQECTATGNNSSEASPDDSGNVSVSFSSSPFTCSLYLAPSTLPGAGLGIFTAEYVPAGSSVGRNYGEQVSGGGRLDDMFIPIADHYKTLPYRGQQRFLSWLGYVWPREHDAFYPTYEDFPYPEIPASFYRVEEGLNAARDGFFRVRDRNVENPEAYPEYVKVSAFAPGVASLVNSHPDLANVLKNSTSERTDHCYNVDGDGSSIDDACSASDNPGVVGSYSPHHGVSFSATKDIAAGSELLMDYGGEWQDRFDAKAFDAQLSEEYDTLDDWTETIEELDLMSEQQKRLRLRKKQREVKPLEYDAKYDREDDDVGVPPPEDVGDVDSAVENKEDEASGGGGEEEDSGEDEEHVKERGEIPVEGARRDVDWLKENGVCVDTIRTGPSTIPDAGRGAFSNAFIPQGSVIAPAPLLALKREDMVIYGSNDRQQAFRDVLNFDEVLGHELLLNYCYGHPDSPLLLLPYSPVVNFINHDGQAPNAEIRWPKERTLGFDPTHWLDLHPLDVLDMSGKLMMEFVALRDIAPGEEIRVNYGTEWENEWIKHLEHGEAANAPFRHEIGVPSGFFPGRWKSTSVVYEVAGINKTLKPGEVMPMKWAHNGKPVLKKGAFRVGLPRGISAHIKRYAKERGIIGLYRKLLNETVLRSNDWYVFKSQEEEWFAHRYESKAWKFDMHYVAAWDEAARTSFLRALGTGGFGETALEGVGKYAGLSNMTCFHASFMGISNCDKSKTHADIFATENSGFNFIFPLVLMKNSKPEFDIQGDDANIVIGVNYEYDVAYALGDWAYHKTRAIRYDEAGAVRIVVGAYCAEISEKNAKMMKYIYDGEDPAPFVNQFELPIKEVHWGNGHSLPK